METFHFYLEIKAHLLEEFGQSDNLYKMLLNNFHIYHTPNWTKHPYFFLLKYLINFHTSRSTDFDKSYMKNLTILSTVYKFY